MSNSCDSAGGSDGDRAGEGHSNFGRRSGGGGSGGGNSSGKHHSVAGFLDPYAASQPVQLFPAF